MSSFTLGHRIVGGNSPAYFIADLAANHDGSLSRALDLIALAAEAGADCVKFQHFTADEIVSDRGFRALGSKIAHQSSWSGSVYEAYEKASLPRDWTARLAEEAAACGVDFMSTPYDIDAVYHLDPYVQAYKIGSGDITYRQLLVAIAERGKPVLLATGASTSYEVGRAVSLLELHHIPMAVMQCGTDYTGSPEAIGHANLRVIAHWRDQYPHAVLGLSDHTPGHVTVMGAVALGAKIIEKHFTDDTERVGPDHHFSMTPQTWRAMVDDVRNLEAALGDGHKRVERNERQTVIVQRRSVRARTDLPAGHVLSESDMVMLRPAPEWALQPWDASKITGKRLLRDVSEHECLSLASVDR